VINIFLMSIVYVWNFHFKSTITDVSQNDGYCIVN